MESEANLAYNRKGGYHQPKLAWEVINSTKVRGLATYIASGQSVQCFTTLTVKNFFLISSLNLPSLSLKSLLLECDDGD